MEFCLIESRITVHMYVVQENIHDITMVGCAGYELIYITNEELVIISSYPASPRRITVLVNFQTLK